MTQAGLVALTWAYEPSPLFGGWLILDAPGRLFLSIAAAVFLAAAVYASSYLPEARRELNGAARTDEVSAFAADRA